MTSSTEYPAQKQTLHILDVGLGSALTLREAIRAPADAANSNHCPTKPFTVERDGFSLNAAIAISARSRDQLEHLCRYITRLAICLERLSGDCFAQCCGAIIMWVPHDLGLHPLA